MTITMKVLYNSLCTASCVDDFLLSGCMTCLLVVFVF